MTVPRGGRPAVPGAARRSCGRRHGRPGDLGRAVEVVDAVAEAIHPAKRQIARQGRAGYRGDPQARQAVPGKRLLGQLQDALEHDRDHREHLGAVLLDCLQGLLGVEAAAQDKRGGRGQADQEVEEPPGVEQRRGDDHRLAPPVGDLVDDRRHRQQPVRAGALGALRRPGRARGEDHEAGLVGRGLEVRVVVLGDQRVEGRPLGVPVGPADHPRHALVDPVEQAGELLVVDEHLGALAAGHLDQLRPGEHRVEVEGAGAELGRRQRHLDEAAVVAAHDSRPRRRSRPPSLRGRGQGRSSAGAPPRR